MVDAQPILTNLHLERLYPHYLKPPSSTSPIEISSTITLAPTYSVNNSKLLARFRSAYLDDNEWCEGLAIQKLPGQPMHWRVKDNLVFHQDHLFVPKSLQLDIIESRHDSILAGHPGHARTLNLVSRDYSWPGMQQFICSYCSSCDNCQHNKNPRHKPFGLLQPLQIPD